MDDKAAESIYNQAAAELGYYIDPCLPEVETGNDQSVPPVETGYDQSVPPVATEHPSQEQLDRFVEAMEKHGQAEDIILMYRREALQNLEIEYIGKRRRESPEKAATLMGCQPIA